MTLVGYKQEAVTVAQIAASYPVVLGKGFRQRPTWNCVAYKRASSL